MTGKIKAIIQTIGNLSTGSKYTGNKDAAMVIRRFVCGTSVRYEWDDFESLTENNPEVDLDIRLCWFFARRFPSEKSTEYCGRGADVYFLKIADALENNRFNGLNYEMVKKSLKNNELPECVGSILDIRAINK